MSYRHATGNPMQVLHVGPGWGQRGGIASVLGELAHQQERFRKEHVSLLFFETHGFQSTSSVLRFVFGDVPRFIRRMAGPVEIVHFHVSVRGSFYRKFLLYVLARLAGKKTIFHLHAGNFGRFRKDTGCITRRAVQWFVGGADAAIAVSTATARELRDDRLRRGGLHVIGNTACAAQTAAETEFAPTAAEDVPYVPYVAFAGRFVATKGLGDILLALALLRKQGCCVRLLLAGDGDIAHWEQAAKACGVSDAVVFVGWLDGVAKLAFYRNALVFCMPSYYESFGIATLEAMFCGVPVIGTRLGGFLDLVEEGVTGYLVEPSDPQALAVRIRTLLDTPGVATRMGMAGLDRARRRYSSTAVLEQYIQCYHAVAARKGSSDE
jgi:glycosyltransferase involved in cell wall biosynthesis